MNDLKEKLKHLALNHNLAGIKGGTEVEAMTFEEIYLMKQISRNVVPMTVKIGGPEARNDIEFMISIEINKILAPMIESPYALKNFVETMEDIDKNHFSKLAINIETIFCFRNLIEIFQTSFFNKIDQVTVGRSDLSGSMGRNVDDCEVLSITKCIIDAARSFGKTTSVGGKIDTKNSVYISENLGSDFLNTRHMIINCSSKNISLDVEMALLWEKDFYQYLCEHFPSRSFLYNKRINSINERVKEKVLA
jgi:hypothetical protein